MSAERLILPCECAGTCSFAVLYEPIDWGDGERDENFYVEFYEVVRPKGRPVRDRIRLAVAVLRGRERWTHGLMLSAESVRRMHEFTSGEAS